MPPRGPRPLWLWPNLLSLDAPLVALVWQDFLSRCYPAILPAPARWVLGLTVWAIYLADRLLDARHTRVETGSGDDTARHLFYRQNRRAAGLLLIAVASVDVLIATNGLRPDVLLSGFWTAAAVAAYLAVFAFWRIGVRRWKQPSAAVLFTAGVFLVSWTRIAHPWRTLGFPAAAFFAIILADLFFIERWERRLPASHAWGLMLLLIAACGAFTGQRWFAAVVLSAAALAILDVAGGKLSADARRVLADAILLTPLIFR